MDGMEQSMLDRTDLELRMAAHVARIERANRRGWLHAKLPIPRRPASRAARRDVPVITALPLRSRLAR
jgi:hypothetical protein